MESEESMIASKVGIDGIVGVFSTLLDTRPNPGLYVYDVVEIYSGAWKYTH